MSRRARPGHVRGPQDDAAVGRHHDRPRLPRQGDQNAIDPRFTNARWPASYHNAEDEDGTPCSEAVDFAPYITLRSGKKGIPWTDIKLFSYVAGIIQAAASKLRIKITWGGDFDRDGSTEDQTLADVGHIQRTNAKPRPAAED